jgi:pSer/pThr/pTyr-binding forkhead associated (FHA) protein
MTMSCEAGELDGMFGAGVMCRQAVETDVRVFSPYTPKFLVFQDLVVPLGDKPRLVVGSDPTSCDMVLISARISGRHARIFYHDGCYFIEDLGSEHGTYINGRRITTMTELHSGDEIAIRPYRVLFTGLVPPDRSARWAAMGA